MVATRRSAGSVGAATAPAADPSHPIPGPRRWKTAQPAVVEAAESVEQAALEVVPADVEAAATLSKATKGRRGAQKHEASAAEASAQPAEPAQPHVQPAADPWADCVSSDSDSEDEHGLSAFMSNLASSITSAFQSKAGMQAAQQSDVPPAPQRQGSSVSKASSDHVDLVGQLTWQPEVEVPVQKPSHREALQTTIQVEKQKGLAKQLTVGPTDSSKASKHKGKGKEETAGKGWFDLPAQKIDEDMKRELRLLRLRNAYDPKRFYKSFDNTKFPKHFAFGTVVEGPQDYYSGRLEAAQRRKTTLTEQLLADVDINKSRKRRYTKLQQEATRHQKVKKRKTELPRESKSKHRPKH